MLKIYIKMVDLRIRKKRDLGTKETETEETITEEDIEIGKKVINY